MPSLIIVSNPLTTEIVLSDVLRQWISFRFLWLDKASSASSWLRMTSYSSQFYSIHRQAASCQILLEHYWQVQAWARKKVHQKELLGRIHDPSESYDGILYLFWLTIELILIVNSWFLLIFSIASDLSKIKRLNNFSEHVRPLILGQGEVLKELA